MGEMIKQREDLPTTFHYTTISVPQQLHCAIIPKATVQKYPFGIPSAKRTIKIVKFIDDNLSLAQFLLTQSSGQNDLVGEWLQRTNSWVRRNSEATNLENSKDFKMITGGWKCVCLVTRL